MATNTPIPGGILNLSRSLAPTALMEFFILDISMINSTITGLPGPIFACHNYNDYGSEPLLWQAISYQPFPVKFEGYEVTSEAQQPRPLLTVANLGAVAFSGGVFSALLREFDDLNGAMLTRKRTFLQYLDGQATADPTQEFPDDIFYVDRISEETKQYVRFELATSIDLEGVQLPRRQICANQCPWIYRSGDGCDYAGPPVADQYGNPLDAGNNRGQWNAAAVYLPGDYCYVITGPGADYYNTPGDSIFNSDGNTKEFYVTPNGAGAGLFPPYSPAAWTADICAKTLTACRMRFGQNAILPFGGFPAIARAPLSS